MAEISLSKSRTSFAGIAAVIVALLLSIEVARLTVASAVASDNPEFAARLAPAIPDTLEAESMAQVGQAAAAGGNPNATTFAQLRSLAQTAPFNTTPFLVEAALAERAGDFDRARQLLTAARLRDPRSVATRYLYADVAIRQGKVLDGLREMAVLSRLLPSASVQLVPALAQYARTPGSRDQLMTILGENPKLKSPLLSALAADPSNAELVLALSRPGAALTDSDTRAWQSRLLDGFIARGQYQQAYGLWRQFAGLPEGAHPLLFNGDFQRNPAPHPFNWDFSSSSAGFAEFNNGNLRVLYYGRDDAPLASQLLVLPPGSYRFDVPIQGQLAAQSLVWVLTCVGSTSPIMQLQLSAPGQTAANFTVPQSKCAAQKLQLNGQGQEMPQDSDVRIGPLQLERAGG